MTEERPVGGEQVTDPVEETVTEAPPAGGPVDEPTGEAPAPAEAAPEPDAGADTGAEAGAEAGDGQEAEPEGDAEAKVAELTADLQRLQAEFVNYKRRVERDRELVRENATYAALSPIVEVLDTIDRAREHGDLDPGFRAVAEQLERTVERLGLSKFGSPGDPFDPAFHEALSHLGEDPEVEVTTCKVVVKAGYRIGDRVVRAAQVLVAEPAAS